MLLKRAVLDEKSRVADADNALKLRDNELKLLAESNERLKFNSEKLTKRISSLQQALEEVCPRRPHNYRSSDALELFIASHFILRPLA